jgi:hypothetical protein
LSPRIELLLYGAVWYGLRQALQRLDPRQDAFGAAATEHRIAEYRVPSTSLLPVPSLLRLVPRAVIRGIARQERTQPIRDVLPAFSMYASF